MAVRILFVEDEASTVEVYKAALADAGYEVIVARNGEDGIKMFMRSLASKDHAAHFDVVVVDFRMPIKDGGEVIKAVLAARADQKIILATAYPYEITRAGREFPMDRVHVMRKPFEPDELIRTIEKIS